MTCKYYILFIRDSKKKTDIEREEAMLVKENENILDELRSTHTFKNVFSPPLGEKEWLEWAGVGYFPSLGPVRL